MGSRASGWRIAVAALACVLAAPGAQAQDAPAVRPAPKALELRSLGADTYWSAEGETVGIIVGTTGVVLVDATGSAARNQELQRAIARVTDKPIVAVILTHMDGDHADGLAGLPRTVPIYAHPATTRVLRDEAAARKLPADRLPNRAVTRSQTLTLAGRRIQVLYYGPAHTSGDLVVYLPDAKILFAGDIFCLDQPRAYIKPEIQGSSLGWIKAARATIALGAKTVVAGHGGVAASADMVKFVETSAAERTAIARGVAAGKSLPQIEAEVGEPQPSSVPLPPGAHQARFATVVYGELTGHGATAAH